MNVLTAEFTLELEDALILRCAEGYSPTFEVRLGDFDVRLTLIEGLTSAVKQKSDRQLCPFAKRHQSGRCQLRQSG